jgi:hypothetical protein
LINVGLMGAAVIVVAFGAWASVGLHGQRDALAQSQREGSDPLLYLSTARILALRSLSDENVDLIDRPNEDAIADFDARTASIAGAEGKQGLLDQAAERTTDDEAAARIATLDDLHGRFLAAHQRVRRLADEYEYKDAIVVASTDEARASADLDDAFESEIAATRQSLDVHAAAAAHRLRLLPFMSVVAALAAVAAVAAGMWPRLREYR